LGRKGKDKSLDRPKLNSGSIYKQYNGEYVCESSQPDVETCVEKGAELSSWFSERILNPENMCNFKKGDCGSLFGGSK